MSYAWRTSRLPRRAVLAVAVTAALASAVPVAEASAATPVLPAPALQALQTAGLLTGLDLSQFGTLGPGVAYAYGGPAIGDVLNGGTTVCVTTGSSACSTNAAP
jgi:hypothetical protein